jgi:hypothetical protein
VTSPESIELAFAAAMVEVAPLGARRGRLCAACLAVLPVDGAAVVVMPRPAHRELVCASDDTVQRLEELQVALGEGPSVEAFDSGGPVLVGDLATPDATLWPMFGAAAAATSFGAMFAFPLQVGAIRVGAMDLYRREAGLLGGDDLAAALRVAEMVMSTLLASADDDGDPAPPDRLLEHSSLSREINQATGMMLVQLGVPAEEAYVRLRAFAFSHNRRIGDVARDVVARRLRFDPDAA